MLTCPKVICLWWTSILFFNKFPSSQTILNFHTFKVETDISLNLLSVLFLHDFSKPILWFNQEQRFYRIPSLFSSIIKGSWWTWEHEISLGTCINIFQPLSCPISFLLFHFAASCELLVSVNKAFLMIL